MLERVGSKVLPIPTKSQFPLRERPDPMGPVARPALESGPIRRSGGPGRSPAGWVGPDVSGRAIHAAGRARLGGEVPRTDAGVHGDVAARVWQYLPPAGNQTPGSRSGRISSSGACDITSSMAAMAVGMSAMLRTSSSERTETTGDIPHYLSSPDLFG